MAWFARDTGSLPQRQASGYGRPLVVRKDLRRAFAIGLSLITLQLGCESKIVVASFQCRQTSSAAGSGPSGAAGSGTSGATGTEVFDATGTNQAFALPWSTGFEEGFCDYADGRGSCFSTGSSTFDVVTEPVRSGRFAAAFTVKKAGQVRCIRQGPLPTAAYYGAWYYVPKSAENSGVWNLFHFQGDNPSEEGHLWDISLVNNERGDLRLVLFSYLTAMPDQSANPPIPIGTWFHIEMYLRRAREATGEVAVYQDGTEILRLTDIITDNSSDWAQWYVGNLVEALEPPDSTLYVDDVTMRATR